MKRLWLLLFTGEIFSLPLAWLLSEPRGVLGGVKVAGRPVSGVSFKAVRENCQIIAAQLSNKTIVLMADGQKIVVPPKALGIEFLPYKAAARAWLCGRELSLLSRLSSRLKARKGIYITLPVRLDEKRLSVWVKRLEKPPQNATAVVANGQVQLLHERSGTDIDLSEAKAALATALSQGKNFVFLPTRPRPASVSFLDLTGVTSLRSRVILTMTSRNPSAHRNAFLAVQALDGAVIMPGQILSLNHYIGARTLTKGYLPAPVFINERRDLGIGGGICPVSTAVFQAAVLAGLDIVERHPHSRLVRYSKPGWDATLNYPNKDLKIRNPTGTPIVLRLSFQGRRVLVRVLGAPRTEKIWLETESRREGNQLHVVTYIVRNGQRQFLCKSRYQL